VSPKLNVYALTDAAPAAQMRGALGEPVRVVRSGRLLVLAGEIAEAPELGADALRAHDAAVRRLADACAALLPVRFGSVATEVDFAGREDELLAALDLVRGREQMTLRVYGDAPPLDRGSGTAYLESLRRARAVPQIDPMRAAVAALVRAERTEVHEPPLLASVYHLIDRGSADEYLRAVRDVPVAVRVAPTGPWPAWSFAPEALR